MEELVSVTIRVPKDYMDFIEKYAAPHEDLTPQEFLVQAVRDEIYSTLGTYRLLKQTYRLE